MTTNQTIDGVPRASKALAVLTETFRDCLHRGKQPTFSGGDLRYFIEVFGELRALLDAPTSDPDCIHCCGAGRDPFGAVCGCAAPKPVAQPQGEPVAYRIGVNGEWFYGDKLSCIRERVEFESTFTKEDFEEAGVVTPEPLYAEQPAPVAVVPEGYCIMPRQLTAENGAKALLLGEFNLQVTMECPECCDLEEPTEGCSICDGEGEYGQKHTIPWDKIKFIYSKAVSGLAVKAEPAKSR